jgi:NAD+ synthase
MARERMSILYDLSAEYGALVIGTGNKSEILLGYGTQYGDTACAINPLGNLYKTQVYQLAQFLHIPSSILRKPPSADLWEGQTDEEDLGYPYNKLDYLLYNIVDKASSMNELQKRGFPKEMIHNVLERIKKNEFKQKMPPILQIK